MNLQSTANAVSATEVRLVLTEIFPDATYGAIPVVDQTDAVEAYRAYDDGGLSEAPHAFAAYLRHQIDKHY